MLTRKEVFITGWYLSTIELSISDFLFGTNGSLYFIKKAVMEICAPQRPSENSNNFPRKNDEHVHQHDSYRAPSQGQQ